LGLCALSASASTIIDFATALPPGDLQQSVTLSGITITAWEVSQTNGNTWTNDAVLNNYQQGNALGLGVASASGRSTLGVIRLDFGSPVLIGGVDLSSLDTSAKGEFAIYGSNSAGQPDLNSMVAVASGTNADGKVTLTILINQSFRYLFFVPEDGNYADSDFLLESVTTDSAPEPVSLVMVGAGLLLFGLLLAYSERPGTNKSG